MRSIYAHAMGAEFGKLHPKVQEWFGFSSADGVAAVGRGVMERVRRGPWYTLPGLYIGSMRNIMFPEQGDDVPLTVENFAYVDGLGRETVTCIRTFEIGNGRRFDEYMVGSSVPGRIINYLGTHQHLAVELDLSVGEGGCMKIASADQYICTRSMQWKFPRFLSGDADVRISYDDAHACYRIDASVTSPWMGTLFSYTGTFRNEWRTLSAAQVPMRAKPRVEVPTLVP